MSACSTVTDLGVVRDVLTTVDCNTRNFARLGYESLAAADSPFQTALTVALTIYVAVIGYRLLFGEGARLTDGPMIALKIGAVLALVTSWSLFQTLVFDLAARAPVEIAAVISAPMRGHALASDPVAGLQASYDQLRETANAFAHPPKSVSDHSQADYATASEAMSMAANGLFIATFLFFETRGLFVGWVRALAASAFGLMSGWSLTVLMLHAVDPWMGALSDVGANGLADSRTGVTAAIIVLVFCAAQIGLMLAGIVIARGFRLPARAARAASPTMAHQTTQAPMALDLISRPARLAEQLAYREGATLHDERAHATAAGMLHARREGSSPVASAPMRIGDSYRRPTVTREGRRA